MYYKYVISSLNCLVFFHSGVFPGAKGTQLFGGYRGAGLRGDYNTLMFAVQAVRNAHFVYLSKVLQSFLSAFSRETMSLKRTAPPHPMEKVIMVTTPHLPLYFVLSGNVKKTFHINQILWNEWSIEYIVAAHKSFGIMAE